MPPGIIPMYAQLGTEYQDHGRIRTWYNKPLIRRNHTYSKNWYWYAMDCMVHTVNY